MHRDEASTKRHGQMGFHDGWGRGRENNVAANVKVSSMARLARLAGAHRHARLPQQIAQIALLPAFALAGLRHRRVGGGVAHDIRPRISYSSSDIIRIRDGEPDVGISRGGSERAMSAGDTGALSSQL